MFHHGQVVGHALRCLVLDEFNLRFSSSSVPTTSGVSSQMLHCIHKSVDRSPQCFLPCEQCQDCIGILHKHALNHENSCKQECVSVGIRNLMLERDRFVSFGQFCCLFDGGDLAARLAGTGQTGWNCAKTNLNTRHRSLRASLTTAWYERRSAPSSMLWALFCSQCNLMNSSSHVLASEPLSPTRICLIVVQL